MDALAAIVVAVMISLMGFRVGQKALYELIDTGLDIDLVQDVRQAMLGNASVVGIHNLRTRSMGGLGYIDAHIEVDSDLTVSEAHFIAHNIEHLVKKQFPKIIDVQIHDQGVSTGEAAGTRGHRAGSATGMGWPV
jgi:divalent metal cation (Fe/Co/Zn/Cd) transporter